MKERDIRARALIDCDIQDLRKDLLKNADFLSGNGSSEFQKNLSVLLLFYYLLCYKLFINFLLFIFKI